MNSNFFFISISSSNKLKSSVFVIWVKKSFSIFLSFKFYLRNFSWSRQKSLSNLIILYAIFLFSCLNSSSNAIIGFNSVTWPFTSSSMKSSISFKSFFLIYWKHSDFLLPYFLLFYLREVLDFKHKNLGKESIKFRFLYRQIVR